MNQFNKPRQANGLREVVYKHIVLSDESMDSFKDDLVTISASALSLFLAILSQDAPVSLNRLRKASSMDQAEFNSAMDELRMVLLGALQDGFEFEQNIESEYPNNIHTYHFNMSADYQSILLSLELDFERMKTQRYYKNYSFDMWPIVVGKLDRIIRAL